jgi:biopolymer transport protein ExbB/TolQ
MGPGLGALGNGDMQTLTSNLTVAFNTTTVGLTAGSICYVVSKIRRRWYEEEMNALYDIATTIIEVEL